MAAAKGATLLRAENLSSTARWFEVESDEPLGFAGGQYVIVDSGLVRPNGKAAKRAYSLLTSDSQQSRFELCAQRIDDGMVSGYLSQLRQGARLVFSGPWGKCRPQGSEAASTLVVASDTGITAALGLLNGVAMAQSLSRTRLLWVRAPEPRFVSESFVLERLPRQLGGHHFSLCAPIGHSDRLSLATEIVERAVAEDPPERAFACGDGDIGYHLMPRLQALGVHIDRTCLESFFNTPSKA